jgi:SHS2 domain-containing protein
VKDDIGFAELEHTADWALKVWSPDFENLLITAAKGMYALSEVVLAKNEMVKVDFRLSSQDEEGLLVDFLSELIYFADKDNIAFHEFFLKINDSEMKAVLEGFPISSRKKEIKAVTYHNLEITRSDDKLEVTIVFDV